MDDQGSEKIKPELVARFGKFAFRGCAIQLLSIDIAN
jgi:hypothetical protein